MSSHDTMNDPDHLLVERLIALHPPVSPDAANVLDAMRSEFRLLGHYVVNTVPNTDDRKVALRSIHRACMDTIAAIACNQELL